MKVTSIDIKHYQFKEYRNKTRLYLRDINNLKKSGMWKILLAIAINFISSKSNNEERVTHAKCDNIEIRFS